MHQCLCDCWICERCHILSMHCANARALVSCLPAGLCASFYSLGLCSGLTIRPTNFCTNSCKIIMACSISLKEQAMPCTPKVSRHKSCYPVGLRTANTNPQLLQQVCCATGGVQTDTTQTHQLGDSVWQSIAPYMQACMPPNNRGQAYNSMYLLVNPCLACDYLAQAFPLCVLRQL